MSDQDSKIVRGQVLPPEARDATMPAGTPLGLGFLGAARFAAIRRVLDQAQRAAQSKAGLLDAQGEIANAYVRREVAREQLAHLDTIRDHEADRIRIARESQRANEKLEKLRRRLEEMELEDRIAEREAARKRATGRNQDATGGVAKDVFADFMDELKRMPDVMKAASDVKEQIIREAGGADKMDEAAKQRVEMIDALLATFMNKYAEDKMS